MPAGKDLYDIIREMIERHERRMRMLFKEIEKEVFSEFEYSTPLYTTYEDETNYYYIIDVPFINSDTLHISIDKSTSSMLIKYEDNKGRKFKYVIKIPQGINERNIEFKVSRGFLKIVIKKLY
jgi:HSP20 family molecular chaperone IbpA